MPPAARPLAERFHEKVDRRGPDDCWPWLGPINRKRGGYGFIGVGGTNLAAHRVAYSLARGPIPKGKLIMHTCDNPPCQNPRHLRPGTVAENQADSVAKGRHVQPSPPRRRGAAHPASKLTDAERAQIRAAMGTQKSIAARFGVSQPTISRVRR